MSEYFDKAMLQLIDAAQAYFIALEHDGAAPGLAEIQRFNTLLNARRAMIAAIPNDYFTNPYLLNRSGQSGTPQ